MDIFLIKATQLILALAILIIIHEFGHFFFARLFGTRVEKFYIFFDPKTEIFKWKPGKYIGFFGSHRWLKGATEEDKKEYARAKAEEVRIAEVDKISRDFKKENRRLFKENPQEAKRKLSELLHSKGLDTPAPEVIQTSEIEVAEYKNNPDSSSSNPGKSSKSKKKKSFWGDTEYGIGWIPLGGYCRISGMIDESMDTEAMKLPPKEWEFRTKPAWQRLLIMIAGVLFNFLLAILIYAGIVYATGEKYVPFEKAGLGMAYSPEAQKVGFRDGDIPLAADGQKLDYPADAIMEMSQAKVVTVKRGNDTLDINIPEKFIFALEKELKEDKTPIRFLTYRIPTRVTQVMAGEGAAKAGILKGDDIIAVDSVATPSLFEFQQTLESQAEAQKKHLGIKQATVNLTVVRASEGEARDTVVIPVKLSEGNKMGVGLEVDITQFYPVEEKHYSLLGSIPRGVQMGTDKLTAYAKSMKLVATKEGAKSIGGFGALGSIFPEKWDWIAFWNIAAFLSVALAFMNILPIPALDGGHVLFLLYEIIFRRKPSDKFLEYAQIAGMIFLILLLLYANGMDIVRLFK